MLSTKRDNGRTEQLLHAVSRGDLSALSQLVDLRRGYLHRVIELRLATRAA